MLVDAGAPRGSTATGLTATNLLTFGVLLGLPVLTVPAIIDGVSLDRSIQRMLGVALMLLIALVIGGVVLTVSDKPLLWVGRRAQAVHNRLARSRAADDRPARTARARARPDPRRRRRALEAGAAGHGRRSGCSTTAC